MGKKVFILNHGLAGGGTDTFTINLAKGLSERDYDVSVVMAVDPDSTPQLREHVLTECGIPFFKTSDLVGVKGVLRHAARLYRLLRQNKPDVFHSNMDLFNGVNTLVAWLAGVPVRVSHSHTSHSQYENNEGKHLAVSLYRGFMRRLCLLFPNRYCGCSELAMNYLYKDRWKRKKCAKIIYNGMDLSRFKADGGEREKHDLRQIVTVGRISSEKNPFFIVDIIAALKEQRSDFEFLWVGTGQLFDQVREAVSQKGLDGCVRFLGFRSDVDVILKNSDLFILPSLFEGLPISLIEAQAAGVYSLTADTVTKESDCGICDFLPIDSTAPWVRRISELFDSGTNRQLDETLLKRFELETMLDEIETVYRP